MCLPFNFWCNWFSLFSGSIGKGRTVDVHHEYTRCGSKGSNHKWCNTCPRTRWIFLSSNFYPNFFCLINNDEERWKSDENRKPEWLSCKVEHEAQERHRKLYRANYVLAEDRLSILVFICITLRHKHRLSITFLHRNNTMCCRDIRTLTLECDDVPWYVRGTLANYHNTAGHNRRLH